MQSDIKSYERTLKRMNQYDNNSKDPIERVKGRIEAVCLKTEMYDYGNIQELIELFDANIEQSKKQYINPTAFIFGFFVTTGNKIDKKKINEISKNDKYNEELIDNDVELVDIIRYARFWLKIKNPNGYEDEEIEESNIIDDEENTVNYIIENNDDVENNDDEENNYNFDDENDYNGAAEYKVPGNW